MNQNILFVIGQIKYHSIYIFLLLNRKSNCKRMIGSFYHSIWSLLERQDVNRSYHQSEIKEKKDRNQTSDKLNLAFMLFVLQSKRGTMSTELYKLLAVPLG